jgi:hypothetical protein
MTPESQSMVTSNAVSVVGAAKQKLKAITTYSVRIKTGNCKLWLIRQM